MGPQFLVEPRTLPPGLTIQREQSQMSPLRHVPERPDTRHRRLEYLDAIRGLAALTVVFNHYVYSFGNPSHFTRFFPLGVWWDGMAAVSMFFVLSGFVLSLRHFSANRTTGEREFDYARFFVARVFRIWIPYLAAVLFCVALYRLRAWQLHTTPAPGSWLTGQWGQPLHFGIVLRDAILMRIETHPTLINPSWTLSIELVISLLLPVGIIIAERSSIWLVFVSLLLFKSLHVNVFILHFAAGILLAKHSAGLRSPRSKATLLIVFLLSIPLYNIRFIKLDTAWRTDTAWIISGAGALGILWVITHSPRCQKALASAPLSHLGRVSYGLYLLHAPVLICLTPRILFWFGRFGWFGNWALGLIATLVCSLFLAEGFYRWIEVPSIAAGKRLGRMASSLPKILTIR